MRNKIELYNYDLRKSIFQCDDVLNFQHFIYEVRKNLLNNIQKWIITRQPKSQVMVPIIKLKYYITFNHRAGKW